ncbi:MAG: beta-lactamase family protein [Bacteroidales bacterium]|nr:beta-lactamase family protein [Bacteroidales bacterium]
MRKIRKILFFTLLICIISFDPGAREKGDQISDKLVPGNVRLTNALCDETGFASCEKLFGSFMHKWKVAGASVAVSKDGMLVYARGFGFADTTTGILAEPYSQFRIASVSKLVTAVAIMKLCEEGKLSVQNTVFGPDGILNESCFANPRDNRACDITIAHLLSHEAGWTQRWGDQMFMPLIVAEQMGVDPPADTRTIVSFALSKRLHYTPGTGRSYSNLGYSILGLVIEKVSGMTYEEYCRVNILEPLGIYDMALASNLPSGKAPNEVTYYEPSDVPPKPSIYGTGEMVSPVYGGNDIEALGGAGSWIATAPDLMRLLLAVDGFDTRPDILETESISLMTDNDSRVAPAGWKTTLNNGNWWRTGSFPGTAAMMKRQSDGIAWVVLLNSSTWNGPEIHSFINATMTRIISQVRQWPEYDLFEYSLPLPLSGHLTKVLTD